MPTFNQYTRFLLTLILLLGGNTLCQAQQNYLGYFDLIYQAEEVFVTEQDAQASLALYNKAFNQYPKPFVSDLFIAAQIAFYAKDTFVFKNILTRCFNRGMTFDVLHAPKLLEPIFKDDKFLKELQELYDQRKETPVSKAIHDSVYMHYYREQMIKKTLRPGVSFDKMHAIEKENSNYFNTFLEQGQFPSEQLIGLHTEGALDSFFSQNHLESFRQPLPKSLSSGGASMTITGAIPDDYQLSNLLALYTYLHNPCAFVDMKEKFWQAVQNGYIHLKDFFMLEEWAAQAKRKSNYNYYCENEILPYYYNIYWELRVTDPKMIEKVEQNRKEKHLQKWSVDLMKSKLEQEKGFQFFFGFLNMR